MGGGERTIDQVEVANLGPSSPPNFAPAILNKGKHKKEKLPEIATSDNSSDSPHDSDSDDMTVQEGSKKRKKSKSKGKSSKKRVVTGTHRKPSAAMLKFSMTRYELYDPNNVAPLPDNPSPHSTFFQYDGYKLFMVPSTLTTDHIPHRGVRLDDMHVAIVLESGKYSRRQLGTFWQGEFDKKGMTRASRVPLGHAAKKWKNVGDVDIDGNVLQEGEEGWYYLWHRGLQLLGGQECLDDGLYLQRPSHETDRCAGTTWKKGFRAAIQLPAGHRNDSTFEAMSLPDFAYLPKEASENSAGDVDSPSHGGESPKGKQGLKTFPKTPAIKNTVEKSPAKKKTPVKKKAAAKKGGGN